MSLLVGRRVHVILVTLCSLSIAHLLEAQTIKPCVAGASGDTCLFDITATADGTLSVDTKAGATGDRWRATIVRVTRNTVKSGVGNGSSTQFTGLRSMKVVAGVAYEVIVSYERPLPGIFPAGVLVRFSGPVTVSDGRPRSGGAPEGQTCQQVVETANSETFADDEAIASGSLMTCRIDPAGDTDRFTFNAIAGAAVAIQAHAVPPGVNICWTLHDPLGSVVRNQCSPGPGAASSLQAGVHTIVVGTADNEPRDYVLSFQGVSGSFNSGIPIAYGELKTGMFDTPGDTDAFTFAAEAGDVVQFNTTGACKVLYSPGGALLVNVCSPGGQSGPLAAGVHTILMYGFNQAGGDVYSLSLQKVSSQ